MAVGYLGDGGVCHYKHTNTGDRLANIHGERGCAGAGLHPLHVPVVPST